MNMFKRFLVVMLLPMSVSMTAQESIRVHGVVVDDVGQPVIGAAVYIDGTTTGVVTDLDGNFQLNAPADAMLRVSFIGFKQAVETIDGRSEITITLVDEMHELDEVQIVAYGAQKKVTVTGAVSSVKTEDITRTPTGSVSNMLTGQMAGLTTVQYSGEPGNDAAQIYVRGQATWTNSAPLIQVDGVERALNDIDPNEIESITILKDASATAVFGVRGANGVVLVTTKRGSEGKAQITATTSFSLLMPTRTLEQASSVEYAEFYNQMQRNDNPGIAEGELAFSKEVIEKFRAHSDPIAFPDVDWVDYTLKRATLQTQHNLSVSGGKKHVRYFVSAGAHTQGGLFNNFDLPFDLSFKYSRFNYRSNLDIDVSPSTTLSVNLAGNVSNTWKPYTSGTSSSLLLEIYQATPFSSPGLVDGRYIVPSNAYGLPFTGATGMSYYAYKGDGSYGAESYRTGYMRTTNNKVSADIQISQKLDFVTEGLSVRAKGSYNSDFTSYVQARRQMAAYTPIALEDGTTAFQRTGRDSNFEYVSRKAGYGRNWYAEAAASYERSFEGQHSVSALLLYNQSKRYYPSEYPDIAVGYVGLVGRATYSYADRYLAEFNIGHNGSENFEESRRFGTFPAGSVGWIVSEENFWPEQDIVTFMKLRFTVGVVGNDKIGGKRFMYTPDPYITDNEEATYRQGYSYTFGIDNSTLSKGTYESQKNNQNVTWEKSTKQNFGIDLGLLRDDLRLTFDYYNERRRDILETDYTAPSTLGFTMPLANLGAVDSWGWEATAKWTHKFNEIRAFANLNLMYNQNEIKKHKEAPLENAYQYLVGNRIGSRLQYKSLGIYDGDTSIENYKRRTGRDLPTQRVDVVRGDLYYEDMNGDGVIDENDRTRGLGYTNDPEYQAGLTLGVHWRKWDFSMLWASAWHVSRVIDNVFRVPFQAKDNNTTGGLLRYHIDHTWTEANPDINSEHPRATWEHGSTNNYLGSDFWEKDSKYLRLKNVQIAYDIESDLLKGIGLSKVQASLSAYNLITISPYFWGDPESNSSSQPSYPLTRTVTASLRLSF